MPPCLGYWKIRGLAQPIRLLLNYVGEDFDEAIYEVGDGPEYNKEQWLSVKYSLGLAFPNLPYYIDGTTKITQSNAILRHIARKHALLGKTEEEKIAVDMLLEENMDLRRSVSLIVYDQRYEELKKDFFKQLQGRLDRLEQFLGEKLWFAGNTITACDFVLYDLLDTYCLMQSDCLGKHKKLAAVVKRFEALPSIRKYMASDRFMKRPCFNKRALFK